jgi:hypothetical protein
VRENLNFIAMHPIIKVSESQPVYVISRGDREAVSLHRNAFHFGVTESSISDAFTCLAPKFFFVPASDSDMYVPY